MAWSMVHMDAARCESLHPPPRSGIRCPWPKRELTFWSRQPSAHTELELPYGRTEDNFDSIPLRPYVLVTFVLYGQCYDLYILRYTESLSYLHLVSLSPCYSSIQAIFDTKGADSAVSSLGVSEGIAAATTSNDADISSVEVISGEMGTPSLSKPYSIGGGSTPLNDM